MIIRAIYSKQYKVYSLLTLLIVALTLVIALFENSAEHFILVMLPDLLLSLLVVLVVYLIQSDVKIAFAVFIIHHIGFLIHAILGTNLIKYMIIDAIGVTVGLVFLLLYKHLETNRHKKAKRMLLTIIITQLIMTLVLLMFSRSIGGSKAWIIIGPLSIQVTELFKILFLVYYAILLSEKEFENQKLLRRALTYWGITSGCLAILGEYGTVIVLTFVYLIMTFIFRPIREIIITLAIILTALLAFGFVDYLITTYIIAHDTDSGFLFNIYEKVFLKINTRVLLWISPDSLSFDSRYQLYKGQQALMQGGLLGAKEKNPIDIPIAESDFVFTAISSNLGIGVAFIVVALFFYIFVRSIRPIIKIRSSFQSVSATISISVIFASSMVMILGSTGMFFLTGVPISFISEGGTSATVNCCLLAVIFDALSENNLSEVLSKNVFRTLSKLMRQSKKRFGLKEKRNKEKGKV